jgi:hypothetical protein
MSGMVAAFGRGPTAAEEQLDFVVTVESIGPFKDL